MIDIVKGQIVYSKAGRDKGNMFLVVDIEEPYVYLVDGKLRRLENPKKKKMLHVQVTHYVDEVIQAALIEENRLTNADIRKSLDHFVESFNPEL